MAQPEGTFASLASGPRWQVRHCLMPGSNRSAEVVDPAAAWQDEHSSWLCALWSNQPCSMCRETIVTGSYRALSKELENGAAVTVSASNDRADDA